MEKNREVSPVNLDTLLGGLDAEYLNDRVEAIYNQQATLVDMVKLETLVSLHGDFTRRVCFKTGAILHKLDTYEVMRLLDICPDEDFAVELLKRQAIQNCIAHWTYTDGASLDKLMEIDPLGYFVYASSYVCNNHSPCSPENMRYRVLAATEYKDENGYIKHRHIESNEREKLRKSAAFDWAQQKVILRMRIADYPLAQVVRINELLRQYLSWFEASAVDKFDTYSVMLEGNETEILPAIGRDLDSFELYVSSTIKAVIWGEIKAKRLPPERSIDYADAVKLKERYRGLSNFFAQYQAANVFDSDSYDQKRRIQLDGFMKVAGVPEGDSLRKARIDKELKDRKLIPLNPNCVIARKETKAITFSFGKKKQIETIETKDIEL